MSEPGTSTVTVLGYQLFINEKDTKAVPTKLVYDGAAVSTLLQATINGLESGHSYWLGYKVLNYAGWSELSPILKMVAGRLPDPPKDSLFKISVSPIEIKFGWKSSTDIGGGSKLSHYKIYEGVSNVLAASVSADSDKLTYTMTTGLTAGQSYDISIASVSDISQYGLAKNTLEGARSNPITLWAIDIPSKPTLSLSNTSRDSCSV